MKLLIITQKVDRNDDILGFFYRWIEEFAKRCEQVTVIALGVGEYELPPNVRVFSLGKDQGVSRFGYLLNFYRLIFRERNDYDAVFVHMNPIYVVLGGLLWRLWRKTVGLWYTHRQVDLKLRIAERFTHLIFTVAKESFTLRTKKLQIVGHGIPFEDFRNSNGVNEKNNRFRIVSVGRITPIKNLDVLIEAVALLHDRGVAAETLIVGAPTQKGDEQYLEKLKKIIADRYIGDLVIFTGSIPNNKVKEYYWKSDLSLNLSPTGGVDKAVLESIAAGLPVLVANKAFLDYMGTYQDILLFKERDARDLADKIESLMARRDREEIKKYLYDRTLERASLSRLIPRIVKIYETSR